MIRPRTPPENEMHPAPNEPPPSPVSATSAPPQLRPKWEALAHIDQRGWMAVGILAGGAAAIGSMLGMHQTGFFPTVLVAAMAVVVVRAGWGWLRGSSRRARLREGLLARVEEYGGGVYGTGAGITLLILSAGSLREEWSRASGIADFLRGMTMEFWVGFSGESIRNAVQAGMWPIHWYTRHGLLALVAIGAAAWAGDALADAWRRREPVPEDDLGAAESSAGTAD